MDDNTAARLLARRKRVRRALSDILRGAQSRLALDTEPRKVCKDMLRALAEILEADDPELGKIDEGQIEAFPEVTGS